MHGAFSVPTNMLEALSTVNKLILFQLKVSKVIVQLTPGAQIAPCRTPHMRKIGQMGQVGPDRRPVWVGTPHDSARAQVALQSSPGEPLSVHAGKFSLG